MMLVSQQRDGELEVRQNGTGKCYLDKTIHMGKSELELTTHFFVW